MSKDDLANIFFQCNRFDLTHRVLFLANDSENVSRVEVAVELARGKMWVRPTGVEWPDPGKEVPEQTLEERHFVPGLFKHFKGKFYRALFLARHAENLDPYVVYVSLYDGRAWVRTLAAWNERVDWPGGRQAPRFRFALDDLTGGVVEGGLRE